MENVTEYLTSHVNTVLAALCVSLALAAIDAGRGGVDYASAGQGPLLVVRAGGDNFQRNATGLPLGILPQARFESGEAIDLAPGDAFFIISDGIFECETADGGDLGMPRVIANIQQHLAGPAETVIRALAKLTESVSPSGRFRDDRTIVVAKRVE